MSSRTAPPAGPAAARSSLAAAAELAAYAWAAPLAAGGRAVVIEPETVEGPARVLAGDSATEVVAVLPAGPRLDALAGLAPAGVTLRAGSPAALPAGDGEAALVVWLGAPGSPRELALDELARVLAPGGAIVLGLPAGEGPRAVLETLEARFGGVAVVERRVRLAATAGDGEQARVESLTQAAAPGGVLVLAGRADAPPPVAVLGDLADLEAWAAVVAERDARLAEQDVRLAELATLRAEAAALRAELRASETALAGVHDAQERILALEGERDRLERGIVEQADRAHRSEVVAADLRNSLSWKLTGPLRLLKRLRG